MKKVKWVFYFTLFLYLFYFGAKVGRILAEGQKNYANIQEFQIQQIDNFSPPPNDSQYSILVTLVDQLDAPQVYLEGAWLIIWTQGLNNVTIISLYPVSAAPQLSEFLSPHDPIVIPIDELTSLENLEVINSQNIEWDHTIVIDEIGLERIIQISNNQQYNISNSSQKQLKQYPKPWEAPEDALVFQEGLLQFLCMHSESFYTITDIQTILDLLDIHFVTSLNSNEFSDLWNSLINKEFILDCKFPLH